MLTEDIALELSIIQRQAYEAVRQRIASQATGDLFHAWSGSPERGNLLLDKEPQRSESVPKTTRA